MVPIKTNISDWAVPEINRAIELDLVPVVLKGQDLTQNVTREEFAAIAVQLYEKWIGETAKVSSLNPFDDISGSQCKNEILKAYNLGITAGTGATTFDPKVLITREQLATMLCRTYKKKEWAGWSLEKDDKYTINYSGVPIFDDDAEISEYAKPSVYFMVKYEVINGVGDNKFAPKGTATANEAVGYAMATREQAIVMALRSYENLN